MILLDTGYFVALFTPDDHLHTRAIAWTLRLNEPTLVTEYVLWECVNTFSKLKDRASAHALIEQVRADSSCGLVHASPELFAAGLQLHRDRPDKDGRSPIAFRFTSCASVASLVR